MLFLTVQSAFAQTSGAASLKAQQTFNKEDVKETPKKAVKKPKKKLTKEEKQVKKSQKAMWIAHVLREKKESKKILKLDVVQTKVPVFLVPQNESFRPLVKLTFRHPDEGVKLLDANRIPIRYNEATKNYSLYAYLTSRVNTVKILAQGPGAEKQEETLYLFAPEAREFKTVNVFDSIQFTLGHTYLEYEQTTLGTYTAQSLMVGAKYLSPEKGMKLGYFGEIFSTIYSYTASPINESAQFLEARAGFTYVKKLFKNPRYRSRLSLGVSTINLFSLADLGFSGLFGPNLGLRTEFYKSGKNSFALDLHYTPYEIDDLFGERSIKMSLDWNRNLNNLRRSQIGFSYSDHTFTSGFESLEARLLSVYYSLSF
jgi:hypothetical protein